MKKRNGLKIILKIGMKSQERRTHFRYKDTHTHKKDTHRLRVRRQKTVLHENGNPKKAGVSIVTADKINFKRL